MQLRFGTCTRITQVLTMNLHDIGPDAYISGYDEYFRVF